MKYYCNKVDGLKIDGVHYKSKELMPDMSKYTAMIKWNWVRVEGTNTIKGKAKKDGKKATQDKKRGSRSSKRNKTTKKS